MSLSDEYRVSYDIDTVRDQSVQLTSFVLQRITRDAAGDAPGPGRLLRRGRPPGRAHADAGRRAKPRVQAGPLPHASGAAEVTR